MCVEVQQYVKRVEQEADQKVEGRGKGKGGSSGAGSSKQSAAAAKKAALAAKLEELQLLNQPVVEKRKKDDEAEARRKAKEAEEAERLRIANLPVEDQIEEERAKLTTKTPVTLELFLAWKKKKAEERAKQEGAKLTKAQKGLSKAEKAKGGGLTGRMLFEQHQDIFVDDEEADDKKYERDEKAWIGDDDGKDGDVEGDASGEKDQQNSPEDEHEPPGEDGGEANVGDESLFA